MKNRTSIVGARGGIAMILAVLCISALAAGPAQASESRTNERVMRQIGVMEKIVDKVLIDSPNFLVHGGDNTRGLYVGEFGVILTFDASLVSGWFDLKQYFSGISERFEMETNADGDQVIVIKKSKEKKGEKKEGKKEAEEKPGKDPGEIYAAGKAELIQLLYDYGETLSALRDDQWVILAAFLKGSDYFKEREISRLIMKVKASDLRACAGGGLSESAFKSRIVIEEH